MFSRLDWMPKVNICSVNSTQCVIVISHYSWWLSLMAKQKLRGICRKIDKSWWEVNVWYSLCLERANTADGSKGIIMDWHRSQLGIPFLAELFFTLQIAVGIPVSGSSDPLQIIEMNTCFWRGDITYQGEEKWIFILVRSLKQPLWVRKEELDS